MKKKRDLPAYQNVNRVLDDRDNENRLLMKALALAACLIVGMIMAVVGFIVMGKIFYALFR